MGSYGNATQVDYSVDKPLNREPRMKDLVSSFITTTGAYDRNHGPIPHLSAETHVVTVDGTVKTPLKLKVTDLRNNFPQHEVVCTLQCAGNRRHTMRTELKEVQGLDWGDGAIMNCRWRGPRLRDVLLRAGVVTQGVEPKQNLSSKGKPQRTMHVAFACYQTPCQEDDWYGGSIELGRAMSEDAEVILALDMNGRPLPPNNGFPVRAVVPGVAGARSVKWLDRITVSDRESPNHYQQRDYKILPPEAVDKESAAKFWDKVPAMQCMPVNSVIAVPQSGETVTCNAKGKIEVKGYAVPHGDQGPVVKVEVSSDGGKTWMNAEMVGKPQSKWCWALWKAEVDVGVGKGKRILSCATDAGGNKQSSHPQWNLRGVGYNGFGEIKDLTVR